MAKATIRLCPLKCYKLTNTADLCQNSNYIFLKMLYLSAF
jgi:hypothetical protein